jgi:glucokinase
LFLSIFAGIDLGGTNIKIGLLTSEMKVLAQSSCRTESERGFDFVIGQMVAAVRALCGQNHVALASLRGVGIGCPGPLNLKEGRVIMMPNFPGWRDLPIREALHQAIGLPVVLENDANVAAYGEYRMGAGQGLKSLAMFTLGTGIGGGIVTNGQMVRGETDTAAEFGHIPMDLNGRLCGCGRRGCLEAYCGAPGLVKRFGEAVEDGRRSVLVGQGRKCEDLTAKDIFDAAAGGDALAGEIVDRTAYYLAVACDVVVNIVDPDIIVFAGGMTAAGDLLMKPLEKYARERFFPRPKVQTRLAISRLQGDAGIIGAALCAQNTFETSAS